MKKTSYQKQHENIASIIAETKARNGWTDKEIGKLIGTSVSTICKKRGEKTFPDMSFSKVSILAEASGYDLILRKREMVT